MPDLGKPDLGKKRLLEERSSEKRPSGGSYSQSEQEEEENERARQEFAETPLVVAPGGEVKVDAEEVARQIEIGERPVVPRGLLENAKVEAAKTSGKVPAEEWAAALGDNAKFKRLLEKHGPVEILESLINPDETRE